MGSNEKFCLRWNDFESNISVAFREIREEKDFFDCTLSCGSRQIQAHKLILSACSPFFRTVLKQNSHQHPLLYLKGVEYGDLQAVLNFMYHGEVNVAQEELNSFLSVAEDLQVKGLTQNESSSSSNSKRELPSSNPKREVPPPAPPQIPKSRQSFREPDNPTGRHRPPPSATNQGTYYQQPESDDIQEIPMPVVKTEPQPVQPTAANSSVVDTMGMEVANMEEGYVEGYDDYGGYESHGYEVGESQGYGGHQYGGNESVSQQQGLLDADIDYQIDKYVRNVGHDWVCTECGKSVRNRMTLRNHIEAQHIVTPGFRCDVCGFVSKTRHALRGHKDYNHKPKK